MTVTENYTEPVPLTLDQVKESADGCWYGVPVGSSDYGDVWVFTHDRPLAAAAAGAWARDILSKTMRESVDYVQAFLSPDTTTAGWGRVVDTCGHIKPIDGDCEDGLPPCSDQYGWIIRRGDETTPGALPYLELRS